MDAVLNADTGNAQLDKWIAEALDDSNEVPDLPIEETRVELFPKGNELETIVEVANVDMGEALTRLRGVIEAVSDRASSLTQYERQLDGYEKQLSERDDAWRWHVEALNEERAKLELAKGKFVALRTRFARHMCHLARSHPDKSIAEMLTEWDALHGATTQEEIEAAVDRLAEAGEIVTIEGLEARATATAKARAAELGNMTEQERNTNRLQAVRRTGRYTPGSSQW